MADTKHNVAQRALIGPTLRRLWGFLAAHKRTLFAGLLCAAVSAAINVYYALLLREVLRLITEAHSTEGLDRIGLTILGVFAVNGVLTFCYTFLISDAAQKLTRDLRNRIYEHIQSLPLRFFEDRRTGQLMASITSDVPVVQNTFQSGIIEAIRSPIIAIGALGVMIRLSPTLTLTVALVVPLMVLVIMKASKRMRRASDQIQARQQSITEILQETLAGVRIIKSFTAEESEVGRFKAESQDAHRAAMRAVRVRAAMSPTIEFIGMGGFVVVLWIGGRLIQSGSLQFEALGAFLLSLNQFGAAMKAIGNIRLSLRGLDAASDRLFTLLDTRSDLVEKPDAVTLERAEGEVAFHDVWFGYGDDPDVLRGISFRAEPGEVVALVGPSGAGKSTIANLVPRFYDVRAGSITVDGRDVRDYTQTSLRRQIGIVPQETMLFSGSVGHNIRYGRPDATEDQVRWAARSAHADLFIEALPGGYDTLVGERGAKLSGGQRQRIAIARALLKDPRILILDEATSALDTESETLVQEALNRLMQGRTTLVIAHRLSTIRNANRILVMQDGAIAETGTHSDLMALGGLYARLHDTQFSTIAGGP